MVVESTSNEIYVVTDILSKVQYFRENISDYILFQAK